LALTHRQACLKRQQKNAKEMGAENIEFLLADDNLSTLGSEDFNFINSFIVFQHIPVDRECRLLRRPLSLLNKGGIGALHFTHRTLPPRCAFTLKSIRGFLRYLRYRSYVVNGIVNLIQGYSFERPLPIM
jgi:cyclopropane fatty-acyl-phospholipid synthase-like methyltransferase